MRFLCITIIPLIPQHHGNGHYWLWMDLASAHYTNDTLTFLQQQGICFVPQGCKFTMRRLAPAGGGFLARTQKGYVRRMMEGNSIPGTEAEIQGEGPANSPSNNPLPL